LDHTYLTPFEKYVKVNINVDLFAVPHKRLATNAPNLTSNHQIWHNDRSKGRKEIGFHAIVEGACALPNAVLAAMRIFEREF